MNDFQLVETAYASINITHPVISNGAETQPGVIRVTVPAGTPLQLTPKTSNFTDIGFTVSPQLGQPQNFLNRTVIYTITSKQDVSKQVHYAVTITEAGTQPNTGATLTSFRFEKSKNPFLPSDIEATRIIEGVASLGKVFIFVPTGTSFASLTPNMNYQGTGVFIRRIPVNLLQPLLRLTRLPVPPLTLRGQKFFMPW